jgi:3-deoxy-D-manno-octulosonic-acid transferase
VLQIKEAAKQLPIVEAFVKESGVRSQESVGHSKPKVFVAGSSWPPDEEIFIKYFNQHPEWKLIIAPHVIGEDHLRQIEKLLEGRKVVRYTKISENSESSENADVLIIDCFGLLSSIYRYATVTYVGGGFGVSIHNTLEAAVWGVPVFFGPNNQKFLEAQELKACGGGIEIKGYDDFAQHMDTFSKEPEQLRKCGEAAGNYVSGNAGATQLILSTIAQL